MRRRDQRRGRERRKQQRAYYREVRKQIRRATVQAHNLEHLISLAPWHVRARVRIAVWVASLAGTVMRLAQRKRAA